jgi:two-component system LytT family response regulator
MRLRTIIVDDEELNLKNLEILLQNFSNIELVGCFKTVEMARLFIKQNKVELLFLDVSMPVEDGFDLLNHFPKRDFQVVFVTAHEEYALRAIKTGATDYILKPILLGELEQAINKVLVFYKAQETANNLNSGNKIMLSYEGGKSLIEFSDIIYLNGFDNLTTLYLTKNRKLTLSKTLKYFEDALSIDFERIHKSYIVNLKYVSKVLSNDGFFVELNQGAVLPISRRNFKKFNDSLKG